MLILNQVHEIELIVQQLYYEGIPIDEKLQVGAIMAKLPPTWKDYHKSFKRKGDDLTLEGFQRQLRIEEKSRLQDKLEEKVEMSKFAHVVEIDNQKGKKPKYEVGGPSKIGPKKNGNFKKNVICHYCKQPGHFIENCKILKKEQANNVKENLIVVISEVNMVINDFSWWIDIGATHHIWGDRNLFKKYEKVDDEIELKVVGKGTVKLKFTSSKIVILIDVFHASKIRKNLVSGGLLSNYSYKLVFESDKFALTKNGMFVGK